MLTDLYPQSWTYVAAGLALVLFGLLALAGRRRYRGFVAQFPLPSTPPYISPVDSFQSILVYCRVPANGSTTGGTGHGVEVGDSGFRIIGSRFMAGAEAFWVPWERVQDCEAVRSIDPDGDSTTPGTRVLLNGGEAAFEVADPAGDRVLGYWRLYRRRLRMPAG